MNNFTFDKEIIKTSFSKAASTYDDYSTLQKDTANGLLKLREKTGFSPVYNKDSLILDIGCGTGALAFSFKNKYPYVNLFGCDFSLPMIFKAKEKNRDKNIQLLTSDCDELPFKSSLFDSVYSSLTYQWAPDITLSFREVWRILKPGGQFIFSILGPRTLRELRISYKKAEDKNRINNRLDFIGFYEVDSLSKNLEKTGFEVIAIENILKEKQYEDLWDLLKTLKATGASPQASKGKKNLAVLKETARNYQQEFPVSNGTAIFATYDVVYIAAKKRNQ